MGTRNNRVPKNLSASRPPTFSQKPRSITRKATKTLINQHHLLEKRRLQAVRKGDEKSKLKIEAELAALGGLERYQQASLQGQRRDRGGDGSRVLMDWMKELSSPPGLSGSTDDKPGPRLRILEVGALSIDNACSRSGLFDIERIDLNSQGDGILQQDFMERPLPRDSTERFDVISLSLVLNFVPDPRGRGEMLLRTLDFLREPEGALQPCTPSLFLVLPSPCVANSRYLDEARLEEIMSSLGCIMVKSKTTQRLVYYLWKRTSGKPSRRAAFPKKEVRSGPSRNNFAVVLGGHG